MICDKCYGEPLYCWRVIICNMIALALKQFLEELIVHEDSTCTQGNFDVRKI